MSEGQSGKKKRKASEFWWALKGEFRLVNKKKFCPFKEPLFPPIGTRLRYLHKWLILFVLTNISDGKMEVQKVLNPLKCVSTPLRCKQKKPGDPQRVVHLAKCSPSSCSLERQVQIKGFLSRLWEGWEAVPKKGWMGYWSPGRDLEMSYSWWGGRENWSQGNWLAAGTEFLMGRVFWAQGTLSWLPC